MTIDLSSAIRLIHGRSLIDARHTVEGKQIRHSQNSTPERFQVLILAFCFAITLGLIVWQKGDLREMRF
jgi:hypothetical protein